MEILKEGENMTKQITITVRDYIVDMILNNVKNKSARAEELIVKGYLFEKESQNKNVPERAYKLPTFLQYINFFLSADPVNYAQVV